MKKVMIACLTAALLLTMFGCSNKQNSNDSSSGTDSSKTQVSSNSQEGTSSQESAVSKEESGGENTTYAEAVDVLKAIWGSYTEDEKFSIAGGDMEHSVMEEPGAFDISKTEELQSALKLPEDQFDKLEGAASMMFMMNSNSFTAAAYRLKDGTDVNAFADALKAGILATEWMCGFPDTILIIQVGENHVVAAYGLNDFIQPFKTHALAALGSAQVLVEAPIE